MDSQPTKLFAIVFTFFGLYFFHCSEAKAETHCSAVFFTLYSYTHADQCFDGAQLSPSAFFKGPLKFCEWIPLAFTIPPIVQISLAEIFQDEMPWAYRTVGAKEYYIRTGLSPPYLLV